MDPNFTQVIWPWSLPTTRQQKQSYQQRTWHLHNEHNIAQRMKINYPGIQYSTQQIVPQRVFPDTTSVGQRQCQQPLLPSSEHNVYYEHKMVTLRGGGGQEKHEKE